MPARPYKICFAASEVMPFSKTGGLADVAGALPLHLDRRGHDVRLVTPLHAQVDAGAHGLRVLEGLEGIPVDFGVRRFTFSVFSAHPPEDELEVLFVDCPQLFHRRSIYTGEGDEHLRFAFFSRAVLEICQRLTFAPDILHLNDWHTGLVPLYLSTLYAWDQLFASTKTLLTLHNLHYQGVFSADVVTELGLGDSVHLLQKDRLARGEISFLEIGLLHADRVSTVSPTYAREIQTPEQGEGLHELLQKRGERLVGILNGIEHDAWNPATDSHLAATYGPADATVGKRANKTALLEELGLEPAGDGVPLFGIVSRLTSQKGFDLVFAPLREALRRHDLRLVVLGTGEGRYEDGFYDLHHSFPGKVAFHHGYSEARAHRIEAASDVFLMPSRFEPCGLNQMYSLKYGTAPLVRKTGGLADTVEPFDRATGKGTGFVFEHYDEQGFAWALGQAFDTFGDRVAWGKLVQNAMAQDFSWERQVGEYEALYAELAG